MAIDYYALHKITRTINEVLKTQKNCSILTLAYPDILVTKQQMLTFLSEKQINVLKTREDALDIAAMHHNEELVDWCCETYSFFEMLNCNLTVIDFTSWTGKEIIIDLNFPIQDIYKDKFDIIIDSGTTEHIFNIPQVMINILDMLKINGFVCHNTPFSDPNHGFYSFSPTFYIDFYEDHGAKIINATFTQEDCHTQEVELPMCETFYVNNALNFIIAQKLTIYDRIIYPIQGRYRNSILNDQKSIRQEYKSYENIILIPYNGQSKHLEKILSSQNILILDDNKILINTIGLSL